MILLLGFLLLPKPAFAFDTGDHSDLTWQALQNEGFQETPIQIVQVQNWLTDYYSNSPTAGTIETDVAKLHFDNLFTTDNIRNYWGWLTVNTRNAAQQAARDKDTLKLLTVLGISLHAVQDFYSHSNWVETHPSSSNGYSPVTWFDSPPAPGSTGLYTGSYPEKPDTVPHGGYTSGLNKDSYVRPNWDQAYTFAYAATHQWVQAVQTWVNEVDPTFWSTVQSYSLSGQDDRKALNKDLLAAYRISEWVTGSGDADGHWKGNGSGSLAAFGTFSAAWVAAPDSPFVKEFKSPRSIQHLLVEGLTSDGTPISPPTTAVPTVPQISPLNQRAIIVRTVRVEEKIKETIDRGGIPDFYAIISVDSGQPITVGSGKPFIDATQQNKDPFDPAWWTTLKFVNSTTAQVPIRYELWDEDQPNPFKNDDHCDINPATGKLDLNFNFDVSSHDNTGDITGVHDSDASAVTSQGNSPDGDLAIVKFYVTEKPL